MSVADQKKSHSFHTCTDAEDFLATFGRVAGQSVRTFISRFVPSDHVVGCLLVGSIPLGIGTGASDVDILVLIDDKNAVRDQESHADRGDGIVFSGQFSDDDTALVLAEVIAVLNGIEVDFELIPSDRVRELAGRVSGPGVFLTNQEVRILSRIKTGWVLFARDSLNESCGGLLRDSSLEVHCAVTNLVFALQDLEDARAALADDLPLALYLGRACVERCFASYFASKGYAFLGGKWLRFLKHHRDAGKGAGYEELQRLASLGLLLMFPSLDAHEEEVVTYLDEVAVFLADTRKLIQADKTFRVAFQMCPQVYDPVAVRTV